MLASAALILQRNIHNIMWRTSYFGIFLLVIASILSCVLTISVRKRPGDVYVNAGETAEISCDVDSRDNVNQIVGWFHADSETFINYGRQMLPSLDADKRSRYSVTGSLTEDVYTLRIESISSADAGTYKCGYYGPQGRFTPLVYAVITVRQLSNAMNTPQCRVTTVQGNNPSSIGIGDIVDLLCRWTDDPRVISASWAGGGKLLNTRMESNYVWTRKKLTAADNGQNFTCTLLVSGTSQTTPPRTCSVSPLRILPIATISPLSAVANVGDTVEFTCEGRGLPEITSYMWMSTPPAGITDPTMLQSQLAGGGGGGGYPDNNRDRLQVSNSNVLRIMGIRQQDDGMTVACQVHVASGMSATAVATLHVPSSPSTATTATTATTAPRVKTGRIFITDETSTFENFTSATEWSGVITNRDSKQTTSGSIQTPTDVPSSSTTTEATSGSIFDLFNSTFTIALAICGLILFVLLLFTVILLIIRWSKGSNRQHLKLANGQLPLQVITNDTYGELANGAPRDDKTYEEVTTVVTIRMKPTTTSTTTTTTHTTSPKRTLKSSKSCPIYATPNKLKRSSTTTPIKSSVQYMNMPEVPSHYDTPTTMTTRHSLPRPRPSTPPPPPPPRYEDLPMLPGRRTLCRHRSLGPTASCTTTFSRSNYSSLTSEDDFCESPSVIDAIRANHMDVFSEEKQYDEIPRNNSCGTDQPSLAEDSDRQNVAPPGDDIIEDEYVSLKLPPSPNRQFLNVEGLQYADLLLEKNPSPEIKMEGFPTQYAHIGVAMTSTHL